MQPAVGRWRMFKPHGHLKNSALDRIYMIYKIDKRAEDSLFQLKWNSVNLVNPVYRALIYEEGLAR